MLAKVVAWGTDRTEAVRKMVAALKGNGCTGRDDQHPVFVGNFT